MANDGPPCRRRRRRRRGGDGVYQFVRCPRRTAPRRDGSTDRTWHYLGAVAGPPAGRVPGAAAQRPVVHRHAAAAVSVPARHLASILGRIDAGDRRRVHGERRNGRIIELSVREKVESIHAVDQPTINNLYSSTTQQTDTDRQTDRQTKYN